MEISSGYEQLSGRTGTLMYMVSCARCTRTDTRSATQQLQMAFAGLGEVP